METPRYSSVAFCAWILCSLFPVQHANADSDRDLRLGKGHYNQGFFERAIAPLERVRDGNATPPQLEEALFLLGECYRSTEDFEKGAERFADLLRRFPRHESRTLALLGRGECLIRLNRHREAVQALEGLLEDPGEERVSALYWLGEAQGRSGNKGAAVESYRQLLVEAPSHKLAPYAAYHAGLILREGGKPDQGLALVDTIDMPRTGSDIAPQLWLLRGDLALEAGQTARAIEEYAEIERGDLHPSALAGTCWAARDLEDSDTFQRAHAELRHSYPDSTERREADLLLGNWRAEGGDVAGTDEAVGDYRDGAYHTEAQFWRGWSRLKAGRHADAAEVFRAVAGGDDVWSIRAAYRLEGELRLAEQWSEARQAATEFLARYPDDARAGEVLAGAVESSYRLDKIEDVMSLADAFAARYSDHPLLKQVVRFAAEGALRSGELDRSVASFTALWADATDEEKQELAPRLAWALYQKDPERAAPQIKPLLADVEGPAAAEVGILLGRARVAEGQSREALAAFRTAAADAGKTGAGARAMLEEAIVLAELEGEADAAEIVYRKVIEREPAGPVRGRALVDLAELLAKRGDYKAAIPHFETYVVENRTGEFAAAATLGLAFCRWRAEDTAGARDALDLLAATGGDSATLAEACYLDGRLAADDKDFDRARAALERYLADYSEGPREAEVLREIARVEEEARRPERAIAHLETLVRDHGDAPGIDEALYRAGWLAGEIDAPEKAAAAFQTLVEKYPGSAFSGDAHYRLGDFAYERAEYALCREHYAAALSSPDAERLGERALYRTGWSFVKEESWPEAEAAFAALADRFPAGELAGEALFLAADAAGRRENSARERELLERFVTGHPNHEFTAEGCVRLAELLTEAAEWQRIRQVLDPLRGVELEGDLLPRHRVALGRALVESGAARSAIGLFEDALAEGKAVAAEAQFEMGLAYRALGNRQRAIEVFLNGPILYPFRPWAIRSYVEAGRDLIKEGRAKEAERVLNLALKEDSKGKWGGIARELLGTIRGKESL